MSGHTALARQIGYSEAEIADLHTYAESVRFKPEIKAALRLAEKMTRDAHTVSDEDFEMLRRHYSEPEIVELASVIGLSNYFNRFTTALRIDLSGSNAPYDSYVPEL